MVSCPSISVPDHCTRMSGPEHTGSSRSDALQLMSEVCDACLAEPWQRANGLRVIEGRCPVRIYQMCSQGCKGLLQRIAGRFRLLGKLMYRKDSPIGKNTVAAPLDVTVWTSMAPVSFVYWCAKAILCLLRTFVVEIRPRMSISREYSGIEPGIGLSCFWWRVIVPCTAQYWQTATAMYASLTILGQ